MKTRLQTKENTSSDFIYSERSRSQKISDSSLFTNKKNSTWENWYGKIQNKLEINVDLFSNERVKLSYVHSRLFDDAAEIIQARRERDCVNLYKIIEDFLKELAQLFNDSNKKVNFRREYYNLIQESKKFSEFYTQFQQLSFYLNYHEKQLIVDLKDKIHSRLRFVWIDQLVQSDSLKEIRFYWFIWIMISESFERSRTSSNASMTFQRLSFIKRLLSLNQSIIQSLISQSHAARF